MWLECSCIVPEGSEAKVAVMLCCELSVVRGQKFDEKSLMKAHVKRFCGDFSKCIMKMNFAAEN